MAALVAQVRNASLQRVGILSDDDLASFEVYPVRNGVGTWRIELPNLVRNAFGQWVKHAMAAELAKPGAGIVVALPGGRRVSGPVVTPAYTETTDEPRGRWTFTGVTDTVILADRLAFPDPAIADAQASSVSRGYDTRTGAAETLMHAYVSANIGPASGTSSRRDTRLTMGPDMGRGASRPKSARFANLLELCQELAAPDGLNFEVVQVGDKLEFRTSVPADLSRDIRLDVSSDTLDSADYSYSGPAATTVVVMGQGEAEDRTIVTRNAPPTEWGRVIEAVVDARGSEAIDELNAKGDEVIATNGGTITSLDVVPSAVNASTIGTKWWLGDVVTVNVAGIPVKATVSKVRLTLGPEGLYAGATVGDPTGFDPERVSSTRMSNVESRVSSLERTAEAAMPPGAITAYAGASVPGGWLVCDGSVYDPGQYPALYSAIGTTYGGTESAPRLPNLTGRVAAGRDTTQPEFNALGKTGGHKGIPYHRHMLTDGGHGHSFSWGGAGGTTVYLQNAIAAAGGPPSNNATTYQNAWNQTSAAGDPASTNNLPPYLTLLYIIKA